MSCWVAATVAAELWGISVKEVLERVQPGEVKSQTDLGFLVVDVAPHARKLQPGGGGIYIRPTTFRHAENAPDHPADAPHSSEDLPLGWQERRRMVGATRRAPRA